MRRLLAALVPALSVLVPAPLPVAAQTPSAGQKDTYITRNGKRYHRDGCRYLASSKIPIGLKAAKARGYTPCKVCHPPE